MIIGFLKLTYSTTQLRTANVISDLLRPSGGFFDPSFIYLCDKHSGDGMMCQAAQHVGRIQSKMAQNLCF